MKVDERLAEVWLLMEEKMVELSRRFPSLIDVPGPAAQTQLNGRIAVSNEEGAFKLSYSI